MPSVHAQDWQSAQVQDVGLPFTAKTQPVVVRRDHPRRRDHFMEAAIAEQPAAPEDELPRREVAEPRCHVVQLDLRHPVADITDQHDTNGLITALYEICRLAGRQGAPDEPRLELLDVSSMDPQRVPQVLRSEEHTSELQ